MTPLNVDVQQHFDVQQISGVSFPEYDLDVIDTVKGKELINNQIYFPIAFRSVPRGGKASVITELPPLAVLGTKKADQSNIKRPSRLNVKRSINQNFYNTIVYRFGKSRLEDRFLAGEVRVSGDSLNRIAIQNKVLTIDAPGLRDGPATRTFLQSSADKLLRKFQYGAESFSAEPNYKTGFNIDVGDTIIWDSENLQMINADKANRDSFTRIYEVQNKSLNVKTGAVKLELVNTIFGTDTRFGVVGPASKIASGATTTKIPLKRSFVPDLTIGFERDKWENYLNARVRVHNDDFTFDETVTFVAFDPTLTDTLIVSPALSVPPSEDFLVDMPKYDAADTIWKTVNAYTGPRDTVTSGASSTVFDVDNPGLFFVDGLVRVHTEDYSVDSPKVTITDVTGSTITVDKDLGFTPAAGYEIDLIGFASDEGAPYTFF